MSNLTDYYLFSNFVDFDEIHEMSAAAKSNCFSSILKKGTMKLVRPAERSRSLPPTKMNKLDITSPSHEEDA